eukprot:TRINITY_DN18743_c0_g1_i1.p1 TRINITY_DN18743_c0_g1~~TRINITY_DN18743_c0_g1_i1.p1  ORF type:complete len:1096 (+),score=153.80 TRINITY_DN18743_c0_g1_i1:56-3343(+)
MAKGDDLDFAAVEDSETCGVASVPALRRSAVFRYCTDGSGPLYAFIPRSEKSNGEPEPVAHLEEDEEEPTPLYKPEAFHRMTVPLSLQLEFEHWGDVQAHAQPQSVSVPRNPVRSSGLAAFLNRPRQRGASTQAVATPPVLSKNSEDARFDLGSSITSVATTEATESPAEEEESPRLLKKTARLRSASLTPRHRARSSSPVPSPSAQKARQRSGSVTPRARAKSVFVPGHEDGEFDDDEDDELGRSLDAETAAEKRAARAQRLRRLLKTAVHACDVLRHTKPPEKPLRPAKSVIVRKVQNAYYLKPHFVITKRVPNKSPQKRIWELDFFEKKFRNIDKFGVVKKEHSANDLAELEKSYFSPKELKITFLGANHPYFFIFSSADDRERFYECASALRPALHVWCPNLCGKEGEDTTTYFEAEDDPTTARRRSGTIMSSRSATENMRVWCGTFNLGKEAFTKSSTDAIRPWCPQNAFDIYALGLIDAKDTQADLEKWCTEYFGLMYQLAGFQSLWGMRLYVFARRTLIFKLSNVETAFAATHTRKAGQTGAVAVSLRLLETPMCFVLCNLPAGRSAKKARRRESVLREVSERLQLGIPDLDIFNQFHAVFWMGSLHFCVQMPPEEALRLARAQDYTALATSDEFTALSKDTGLLQGFREGNHSFPPTFPFKRFSGFLCTRTEQYMDKPRSLPQANNKLMASNRFFQTKSALKEGEESSDSEKEVPSPLNQARTPNTSRPPTPPAETQPTPTRPRSQSYAAFNSEGITAASLFSLNRPSIAVTAAIAARKRSASLQADARLSATLQALQSPMNAPASPSSSASASPPPTPTAASVAVANEALARCDSGPPLRLQAATPPPRPATSAVNFEPLISASELMQPSPLRRPETPTAAMALATAAIDFRKFDYPPSYVDRILWRSPAECVTLRNYCSPHSLKLSEHMPVCALFDVAIQRPYLSIFATPAQPVALKFDQVEVSGYPTSLSRPQIVVFCSFADRPQPSKPLDHASRTPRWSTAEMPLIRPLVYQVEFLEAQLVTFMFRDDAEGETRRAVKGTGAVLLKGLLRPDFAMEPFVVPMSSAGGVGASFRVTGLVGLSPL